ncbi:condensation domain-containing protein [Streptomyces anulatus]
MTWGQRAIWKSIRWLGDGAHYFNICRIVPIPADHDTPSVLSAVGDLLSRHEALRTVFHDGADTPAQEVAREGAVRVSLSEAPVGTGDAVARRLSRTLASTAFDLAAEWPVRCALVTERGGPVSLVMVFSHLGVDGWALGELIADLRDILHGKTSDAPSWQPLDQARYESGPVGVRRHDRSLDFWRRTLPTLPAPLYPGPPLPHDRQRFVRFQMDSPATAVATTIIAERCRVSTAGVLLAATAAVLGARTGHDRVGLLLISSNRHDEPRRRLVGAMTTNALFAVDTTTGTFDDLVRRTSRASMNSYRFAQYDPIAMDAVLAEADRESGGELDVSAFFNDVRLSDRWDHLPQCGEDPDELRELTSRTRTRFIGSWEKQDATFFVHTAYAPDTCLLHLMTDTARIPLADIEPVLRDVEALLVESAAAPTTSR